MTWLSRKPSRRAVVFGLIAIALPPWPATAGVSRLGQLSSSSTDETLRRARTLAKACTRYRRAAARVGRHYFLMAPEERDLQFLLSLIQHELPDPERLLQDENLVQVQQCIADSVRNDFECGQTVQVQGWVLSRTEARLAGLAVLI